MPRIEAQSGTGFRLRAGERLRVVDVGGGQVADLIAFEDGDPRNWLSSGRSIDYANRIYLSLGYTLYSNRSDEFFTIVADDVGRHDFLLTPCSQETFDKLYAWQGHHPSCFENLAMSLREFGIAPDDIPTTFNIFMNVLIGEGGELSIEAPLSRPGDALELRAERDLIVGLTSCSAEKSNDGSFGPIDYQILAVEGEGVRE